MNQHPAAAIGPDGHGFFRKNRPMLLFFASFAAIFLALMTIHFFTRFHTAYFLITVLNADPSAHIINGLTPAEQAVVEGQVIRSGSFALTIARGCDGMDGILLVTAALLAFPMPWRRKLLGVGLGILLLYVANLIRIVSLYYIARYRPDWFDAAHIGVWQTLTIFIGVIYFAWWVGRKTEVGGQRSEVSDRWAGRSAHGRQPGSTETLHGQEPEVGGQRSDAGGNA
jgi:exosortase family protein XrtM